MNIKPIIIMGLLIPMTNLAPADRLSDAENIAYRANDRADKTQQQADALELISDGLAAPLTKRVNEDTSRVKDGANTVIEKIGALRILRGH